MIMERFENEGQSKIPDDVVSSIKETILGNSFKIYLFHK